MSARRLPPGIRKRVWPTGAVTYEAFWRDAAGRQRSESFDTAAEADAARQERLRERRRGGSADPTGGRTLLCDWWKKWIETRQVVDSTRARDESIWACQIEPVFGKAKLAGLRRSDIARWVADLVDDYAAGTVTRCLVVLKKCLNDAVAEGLIGASPAAGVKPPRPDQVERRFLALAELARLEAGIDPHWRLVIPFAAQTGLRIGELAALTVGDLNLAAGEVRVRATAVGVPKRVSGDSVRRQLHQPKTYHGERVVPTLTEPLVRRLVVHIAERGLGPADPLFAGPRGGPMDPGNWRNRVWAPAVEAARLTDPQPTPHSLRHTAVALWIAAGADRLTVARWAGHGDAGFTERVYGHLFPDTHDRTRAALESVLAGHVTRLPTGGSTAGLKATSG